MGRKVQVELPFGEGNLSVAVDEERFGEVALPRKVDLPKSPERTVREALENPVGTPPLEAIVRPGERVAVIIDDITRETPTRLILPMVLEALGKGGVRREDVAIVIALGTHRPMTEREIDLKIGPRIARDYRIVNVPAWEEGRMVDAGVSSAGIPARLLEDVVAADRRIGIGMIVPHMDAGFGGGAKIILPGVCATETVEAFHARMATLSLNPFGMAEAPLRTDLEAFVGERIGLDFILNAVLDCDGALYRCVAGHFIHAHREGIRFTEAVYGAPVSRRHPVVVTGAFPHQIDLWQATKGLAGGDLMTEDGGTLILLAQCPEGVGPHPAFPDYIGRDPEDLQRRMMEESVGDPVAAAVAIAICRMRKRIRLSIISPGIDADVARRMGFSHHNSVEAAIAATPRGAAGTVAFLPHGGVTLPLLNHENC